MLLYAHKHIWVGALIYHGLPNSFLLFNICGSLQFFSIENDTAMNIFRKKASYKLFPQGRAQEMELCFSLFFF